MRRIPWLPRFLHAPIRHPHNPKVARPVTFALIESQKRGIQRVKYRTTGNVWLSKNICNSILSTHQFRPQGTGAGNNARQATNEIQQRTINNRSFLYSPRCSLPCSSELPANVFTASVLSPSHGPRSGIRFDCATERIRGQLCARPHRDGDNHARFGRLLGFHKAGITRASFHRARSRRSHN